MRFALVAVARVSGKNTDDDERRANRLMTEGEDDIEHWIERHYGKRVMCQVCGERGIVDPADENDLVVTVAHNGEAFIACEDCLQAFIIAGTLGMETDAAERMVSRIVLHIVERSKAETQQKVIGGMMQSVTISRSADAMFKERHGESPNESGVSAEYKAAMREAFKR